MNNMSAPVLPATLDGWLSLLEQRHPLTIDLGLARVGEVARRLDVCRFDCPVITVAGTNGKGSTVATLEALAGAHGKTVATYSSPHLLVFNERIRINGANVADDALIAAFVAVEQARGKVSLTYFEFTTLAALWLFRRAPLDLLVLEVGLGGRLDAVNLVDADVAVITSIDFDHMNFLGNTLEKIAAEKAGICRAGRPVVLSDASRHAVTLPAVLARAARPVCAGVDWQLHAAVNGEQLFSDAHGHTINIGQPQLGSDLVAGALMAFRLALPGVADAKKSRLAISRVQLAGRWQIIADSPLQVLDVAHNAQATARLYQRAMATPVTRWHLVLGMLSDKDRAAALAPWLQPEIPCVWYLCDLDGPRGGKASELAALLPEAAEKNLFVDVPGALRAAQAAVRSDEGVLIFGSFLTVTAALTAMGGDSGSGPE